MRMKKIRFYGELRRQFGMGYELAVANPAEALRALIIMVPGLRQYFQERLEDGFVVLVDKEEKSVSELGDPVGCNETIRFVPVVAGAKSGLTQIIIGAALIAAVVLSGGTAAPAAGAMWASMGFTIAGTSALSVAVISVGMSMMIGGVAQLLAPTPGAAGAGLSASKDGDTWSFGSPTVTAGQGGCVPLGYGTSRIGGALISSGVDAQTWQIGGFGGLCATDDGTRYGNGDTIPWSWAIDES